MSKAEKFIQNYARNCSNECWDAEGSYHPWLSIDEAKKAVEIAREEIYEWLEENAVNFVALADNEHPAIGDTKAFYGTESLIYWLKQAIEDE